jgi:hypothetical protein
MVWASRESTEQVDERLERINDRRIAWLKSSLIDVLPFS